jgi:hypothetical protein
MATEMRRLSQMWVQPEAMLQQEAPDLMLAETALQQERPVVVKNH